MTLTMFSWWMKQIFIFVAMSILKTVATGQPRSLAIFTRNLYILRRLCIVWCGVASFGVIGPYILEDEAGRAGTVNSARYTEMLSTFLEPELPRLGVETQTLWFQQDRATAHTVRTAMWVLNEMFPACVISRKGNTEWPARLPHLKAWDFLLWGYIKSKVYEKKQRTMVDLKQNIRDEVGAISSTMLQQVIQNFQKRLQECVDKGHHLTDTIFRKWIL